MVPFRLHCPTCLRLSTFKKPALYLKLGRSSLAKQLLITLKKLLNILDMDTASETFSSGKGKDLYLPFLFQLSVYQRPIMEHIIYLAPENKGRNLQTHSVLALLLDRRERAIEILVLMKVDNHSRNKLLSYAHAGPALDAAESYLQFCVCT